ncbi:beta galactosidase jelly roll domain-containing protein [Cellulophaga baltica]|uniref:glycoside hydrolase family 2 protein n=1 Tax=Cellulophaga baltica TaxID=76594 RepID=UPI002147F5D1|nr:glycoside hydrolase family 2 TIM barrel-domain containing protein [Cellulophaga baltica]MCR1024794.1 beta galactosidase jelly roll domain-containing protein [Cellulophaga baltica]
MKIKGLVFFFLITLSISHAQSVSISNSYNRDYTSLNGQWNYIVDPYENGFYNYRYEPFENQKNPERSAFFTNSKPTSKSDLIEYDFDKMDSITVPSDWNTQKEKLYYYEGSVWYKKSFDYTKKEHSNRVFIYFEASNYKTDVYLNGKKIGQHLGGFTPFNFEVTHLLKEKENFLITKVDNKREKDAVPTLNTDWWNYGGITRDVKIIETSETFISDYFIHLDKENSKKITGYLSLNGTHIIDQEVTVEIPALKIKKRFKTDANGKINIDITASKIKLWSTKNPQVYKVIFTTATDTTTDEIGFRTIATQGADILLNGKKIFLKGISIHEESPITGGRGNSLADSKQLLEWAQELGCNYVRLAHYPHNEHMLRLADKMGILVWEENPVYWTISWDNESTYDNAKNQLSEVIQRDKNRASVIIWSMANETPTTDARNTFLTRLAKYTKEQDPTRLISAALEQSNYEGNPLVRTIHDPFAEVVDILSFNQYIGWYDGTIEKCQTISWNIQYNKPVLISEFGAGAKFGLHGPKEERWNEEYQEYLYEETLKMIDKIDQLSGFSPWILVDFRSPRRLLPEIQDEYNRKGLISEKGEKKKAFYTLQKYYNNKN